MSTRSSLSLRIEPKRTVRMGAAPASKENGRKRSIKIPKGLSAARLANGPAGEIGVGAEDDKGREPSAPSLAFRP